MISAEGLIPANEDGLARLVLEQGTEARAAAEMMSGAVWVRDRLEASGWKVKVAHARKVRDVAPLACKTDKVDARVLAELCRRDLVPELWVPSIEDRALRERLRRRMHLVKARTSARKRIFGLLTQFGLRISHARLRKPDAIELLERRGVPEVWRDSIAELLELAAEMDRRIDPIDREDAGLAPRISQSGERSATGALSKAGSRTLRWAAVEAANNAWRPSNPWHRHHLRVSARHGKNPAKSAVARKLLIAAWHMLSRQEPFNEPASANSSCFLTARRSRMELSGRGNTYCCGTIAPP